MSKPTGLIPVVLLLVVGGIVDRALLAQRSLSPAVEEGVRRAGQLPESIGTWAGEATKVDEALLKNEVAAGGKILQYRDGKTGHSVYVALLAGHPGRMTDQPPEKSFRSIGFAFDNQSLRKNVLESRLRINVPGSLTHMDFWSKDSKVPMRCWQGWFDGKEWSRPEFARWRFLDRPVLYRLQVWSLMADDPMAATPGVLVDPSQQFLVDALPTITKMIRGEGGLADKGRVESK